MEVDLWWNLWHTSCKSFQSAGTFWAKDFWNCCRTDGRMLHSPSGGNVSAQENNRTVIQDYEEQQIQETREKLPDRETCG